MYKFNIHSYPQLLESIRIINKDIKLFCAGSSECFGNVKDGYANEQTPFMPEVLMVALKPRFWNVANYRESYDMLQSLGF